MSDIFGGFFRGFTTFAGAGSSRSIVVGSAAASSCGGAGVFFLRPLLGGVVEFSPCVSFAAMRVEWNGATMPIRGGRCSSAGLYRAGQSRWRWNVRILRRGHEGEAGVGAGGKIDLDEFGQRWLNFLSQLTLTQRRPLEGGSH